MIFSLMVLGLTSSVALAQECPRSSRLIRVSAVGDILVHKALYENVIRHPQRFRALWQDQIAHFQAADFMVGNLEGPVAPGVIRGGKAVPDVGFIYDDRVYSGTNFVFNYHPHLLTDLRSSGFDFVSMANNHTMDRGPLGVDRTIEQLERAGLQYAGVRPQGSTQPTSQIAFVKGAKLGLVSCTESTNGIRDPRRQVTLCKSAEVIQMIRELKGRTDAVIVFPHWGDEYKLQPHSRQRQMARTWVEAGATLILGNHPHVLQTVEWMANDKGSSALVVYSLGNFVAAQGAFEKRMSAIAHVDFGFSAQGLVIEQFSYTPTQRPRGSIAHIRTSSSDSQALSFVRRQLGPARCAN